MVETPNSFTVLINGQRQEQQATDQHLLASEGLEIIRQCIEGNGWTKGEKFDARAATKDEHIREKLGEHPYKLKIISRVEQLPEKLSAALKAMEICDDRKSQFEGIVYKPLAGTTILLSETGRQKATDYLRTHEPQLQGATRCV